MEAACLPVPWQPSCPTDPTQMFDAHGSRRWSFPPSDRIQWLSVCGSCSRRAVRHRSGLRARDHVLVAADPHHDVLGVHPIAALDSMITAYHASLTTGGDAR